jgi:beta-lactamase regulating signal transducer with metallopeptidase domain
MGHPTPRVILPVVDYTREELRVILIHEMTHYKQKDLTLKLFMRLVLIIHYFNPLAWVLLFKIQKWSEFACDLRASQYVGGIKPYFEVIMRIAMENPLKSGLASHLVHNQHELVERVKKQVRISKMKRRSRWSVVLVLCTAFMLSSTTVYAATGECADAYVRMESETSVEDEYQYPETASPKIHMEYGDTERITCVEGENVEQSTRDSYGFQ